MQKNKCVLCAEDGGRIIWKNDSLRIIHTPENDFPAFYRVVWNQHVAEFSDLSVRDRHYCVDIVALVEKTMCDVLNPDKINLASLGNMVPHLHWHIIARFNWDSHFPDAIWAPENRALDVGKIQELKGKLQRVDAKIIKDLG